MRGEPYRLVLLGTRSTVAAQLHLQVQSDRRGGAEETVPARVPQRLLVGGRVEKVRLQPHERFDARTTL